jgi:predicted ester cyclase
VGRVPRRSLTIEDTVAEADKLALRFNVSGRHDGEFMGVAPTGRPFVLNGQTVMLCRDGQVLQRWTIGNMLGLLMQLGAIPAPAA